MKNGFIMLLIIVGVFLLGAVGGIILNPQQEDVLTKKDLAIMSCLQQISDYQNNQQTLTGDVDVIQCKDNNTFVIFVSYLDGETKTPIKAMFHNKSVGDPVTFVSSDTSKNILFDSALKANMDLPLNKISTLDGYSYQRTKAHAERFAKLIRCEYRR